MENINYYYKLKVKKYQDMFIILKIEINGFSRPVGPLYPPPWLIGLRKMPILFVTLKEPFKAAEK